ncbi:MAG TPA: DUF948 domain-containing protein [Nitrospirales bacterium]|nr:DUF948 domain-containing protein [Nitrospirales bacterium]
MTIEFAVSVIAVACVALVGFLIAALIAVRRAAIQTRVLLEQLSADLPSLLGEVRVMVANVNTLAVQVRDGVEHASVLLHAMGDVGETVQEVHGMVRGQGESVVSRLMALVSGVKAAAAVVRDRFRRERGAAEEGGDGHGGL